jgi:hypothetical protein
MCTLLSLAACESGIGPRQDPETPVVLVAIGRENPENVLSARVVFSVIDADSVRVRVQSEDGQIQSTKFRPAKAGTDTIIVLGLRPNRVYQYEVEAVRDGTARRSVADTFKTSVLPSAVADIQMKGLSGVSSHYALTSVNGAGNYVLVFDSSGAVVWYQDFTRTGLPVSNPMKQPNGNFTAFLGTSTGSQAAPGYFVEFTPEGQEVATYTAPSGYVDFHELLLTGAGSAKMVHFFTYSIQTLDLTSVGGLAEAQTAGHQLVRTDAVGAVQFRWDAWFRIGLDEWVGDDALKSRTITDFDHPNAITFDANGNYVVSWRNLNQIMAIDARSGDVLWRLGGTKGEYTFVDDPLNGFSRQHAVKILPNGNVLLFDNGSDHWPPQSRAVEYRLDPVAKTATMVWESRHDPSLYAAYVGWVERLDNGNTWIAYSIFGRAVEVNAAGKVVWEGQLRGGQTDLLAYRIVPLTSPY